MGRPDLAADRPDRFEALYQSYYQAIFSYVLRRVPPDLDSVADLVAEVFVVALRRQDVIPEPPGDRLWLYGVARRVLLDEQRRRTRRVRLEARLKQAAITDLGAPDGRSAQVRVRAAMQQLNPAHREALQLVAWDGLSHAEAAHVLGCSANAVALRVHKAKTRLRVALASGRGASGSVTSGDAMPGYPPIGSRSEA